MTTPAVVDDGMIVGTTENLGDGFIKITISGKEYLTRNLELWAVECGYTLLDLDEIELIHHPLYTEYIF